jgi:LPXTG-site transpeptidase (sortase) family protein
VSQQLKPWKFHGFSCLLGIVIKLSARDKIKNIGLRVIQHFHLPLLRKLFRCRLRCITASGQEVSVPSVTVPESSSKVAKEFSEAILEIPAIKLTTVVLKGTSQDVLAKAPGWYEESAPPGQGNTAIAGHLNTNGRWFRNIEKLKPGEEIILKYEGHVYLYAVEKVFPVQSTDWSIIDPCGYNALTLTTCIANDRSRRLIVRARQVSQ